MWWARNLIWGPAIPIALVVLAIAQMGVHLVFFLHITTAPDNTNNVLALAFGVLIVVLIIGGSVWIMDHLNQRHDADGSDDADAAVRTEPSARLGADIRRSVGKAPSRLGRKRAPSADTIAIRD